MKEIMIHLIQEYLKNNGLIQTYLQLEKQAKINIRQIPKEIQFFKKILLKGDFSQAVQFIWTFEYKLDKQTLNKFTLIILKQKLYELLENPQQKQLRNLFQKQIVDVCSEEEYQHLFTLLTCRTVKQIQGLSQWTPIKGRFSCYQAIAPYLQNLFNNGSNKSNRSLKNITFTLQEAVNNLINIQNEKNLIEISQYRNSRAKINVQNSMQKQILPQRPQELPTQSKLIYNKFSDNHSKFSRNQNINQGQISESRVEKSQGFFQKSNAQSRNASEFNRKVNTYVGSQNDAENISLVKSKDMQGYKYSKLYEGSQLKAEEIDQQSQQLRYHKKQGKKQISYLKQFQREKQHNQSSMLQEQVKKNIAYLDQNNQSQIYQEDDHEHFTFSHGAEQSAYNERDKKILKLASILDPKAIRTCQFSSNATLFALGTNSSFLKIFDVEDLFTKNQPKQLLPVYQIPQLHSKSIFSLNWSSNQKAIVTCSNDLTIKITDFITDGYRFGSHHTNIIGRHQSCIRMVKFNSLESRVISCGDDCLLKVWDIGKIKKCMSLKGHEQGVSAFRFGQNEGDNIIYSVGKDSMIRKWDLRVGYSVDSSDPQDSQMTFIADNTDKIVVSHKNGYVSFFDESLRLQNSIKIHQQQIRSIDGTNYDDLFLTASFDGHISLFTQKTSQSANYHQHNQLEQDKVVFATFINHPDIHGFASTSTLGICNIFSYQ